MYLGEKTPSNKDYRQTHINLVGTRKKKKKHRAREWSKEKLPDDRKRQTGMEDPRKSKPTARFTCNNSSALPDVYTAALSGATMVMAEGTGSYFCITRLFRLF